MILLLWYRDDNGIPTKLHSVEAIKELGFGKLEVKTYGNGPAIQRNIRDYVLTSEGPTLKG